MPNATRPSLLRRLMGWRAVPVVENDPADMGTAMGLDFCLDEAPMDAPASPGMAVAGSDFRADWLRRASAS